MALGELKKVQEKRNDLFYKGFIRPCISHLGELRSNLSGRMVPLGCVYTIVGLTMLPLRKSILFKRLMIFFISFGMLFIFQKLTSDKATISSE